MVLTDIPGVGIALTWSVLINVYSNHHVPSLLRKFEHWRARSYLHVLLAS